MQIQNFYTDPVPSIRSPLDSIVLSPHTIKPNDFGLANSTEDCCDYQTLLPSISECQYYGSNARVQKKSLPRHLWEKCCRFVKKCDPKNDNP